MATIKWTILRLCLISFKNKKDRDVKKWMGAEMGDTGAEGEDREEQWQRAMD